MFYFLWSCCERRDGSASWFTHGAFKYAQMKVYDKDAYICCSPVCERPMFYYKREIYDNSPCYVKGQSKAMDFLNMIRSLIEIDAKVLEVTNDRTKMYLQAISSEIGPKLQLCCEAVLCYGFVIKRG